MLRRRLKGDTKKEPRPPGKIHSLSKKKNKNGFNAESEVNHIFVVGSIPEAQELGIKVTSLPQLQAFSHCKKPCP